MTLWIRHALYAMPVALLITIICYSTISIKLKERRGQLSAGTMTAEFCLIGYLNMLALLTMTNPYGTFGQFGVSPNAQVFKAFVDAYEDGSVTVVVQFFMNIVLFLPLGFLLPCVFTRMRKLQSVALCALGTSCFIETVQFFIGRTSDIDDVLTNFIGGVLGFIAWQAAARFVLEKEREGGLGKLSGLFVPAEALAEKRLAAAGGKDLAA